MILYSFTLSQVAIAVGIVYILGHGVAMLQFERCKTFFLEFHRDEKCGVLLLASVVVWVVGLLTTIDLMDYTPWRLRLIFTVLILAGLVVRYLRDFLGVRAVGVLLLLVANVLLDAAFLRDEPSKFVITILAYAYIIEGMILVCVPYVWRDLLIWAYSKGLPAWIGLGAGCLFGLLLLILGFFVY